VSREGREWQREIMRMRRNAGRGGEGCGEEGGCARVRRCHETKVFLKRDAACRPDIEGYGKRRFYEERKGGGCRHQRMTQTAQTQSDGSCRVHASNSCWAKPCGEISGHAEGGLVASAAQRLGNDWRESIHVRRGGLQQTFGLGSSKHRATPPQLPAALVRPAAAAASQTRAVASSMCATRRTPTSTATKLLGSAGECELEQKRVWSRKRFQ